MELYLKTLLLKVNMKESTLLKISLVISFIGLIFLYLLSNISVPITYKPGLDHNNGDFVKVEGVVTKISGTDEVTFIDMNQFNPVKIVIFDNEIGELKKGDKIEVIGTTEQYKGENEIIASRIRKIV
tara:strand:- start:1536 stop:1916 length:381 start_codon:yes stop_codon:yes gene_type:complete